MKTKRGIPIRNLYCMLCYASDYIPEGTADNYGEESFENIHDVMAMLLDESLKPVLRRGLYREYQTQCEALSMPRGKIDFEGTFRELCKHSHKVCCDCDEFTVDNRLNQIIRWALKYLLRSGELSKATVDSVAEDLDRMYGVSDVRVDMSYFDSVCINNMNHTYEMVLNICKFVYLMKLINEGEEFRGQRFTLDKVMNMIYEQFLRNFFRIHFTDLEVGHQHVDWDIIEGTDGKDLPQMKTDIFIHNPAENREVIIDAKFYKEMMGSQFEGSKSLDSGNLYQIYSYINNHRTTGSISGMLIYPEVDGGPYRKTFRFKNGRDITAMTVNLNDSWENIEKTLLSVHGYCVG